MAGAQNRSSSSRDRALKGMSRERAAHLRAVKARVASGFYNSDPVLDDLSYSFTKAVDALI